MNELTALSLLLAGVILGIAAARWSEAERLRRLRLRGVRVAARSRVARTGVAMYRVEMASQTRYKGVANEDQGS